MWIPSAVACATTVALSFCSTEPLGLPHSAAIASSSFLLAHYTLQAADDQATRLQRAAAEVGVWAMYLINFCLIWTTVVRDSSGNRFPMLWALVNFKIRLVLCIYTLYRMKKTRIDNVMEAVDELAV